MSMSSIFCVSFQIAIYMTGVFRENLCWIVWRFFSMVLVFAFTEQVS